MRKQLKMAAFAAVLAVGFTANAQISTDQTSNSNDITKNGNATRGKANGSVRVIDNKGTIKYIQAKNGLTTFTNFDPSTGGEVTTWQLGGELNGNTYIEAGSGKEFALDGLELVTDLTVAANQASTNAADRTSHDDTTVSGGSGTGFTVLIRDEATGAVKKIKLSDLLQVTADHKEVTVSATQVSGGTASLFTAANGVSLAFKYPNVALASYSKVTVFRNGAKLRANTDYELDNTGTVTKVVLKDMSSASEPNEWTLYQGDQIEIHAIK